MQRIRKRLRYANVVATLALFLALGGGTALAAFIVTSNADIGPDTIAGHSPPSDAHSNLIAGSITEQDIKGKSLTDKSISERSLTGDALKIAYQDSPSGVERPIASVGGYKLSARCISTDGSVILKIYASGPYGTVNWMASRTEDDRVDLGNRSWGFWLQANTEAEIMWVDPPNGHYDRLAGTLMLNTGSAGPTLVEVHFNAIANNNGGGCFLLGTATRAT